MTTRKYYPNDPPLMWYQEAVRGGTNTTIGCTACPWELVPSTIATGKGWRWYERLFNEHKRDAHPTPKAVTAPQLKNVNHTALIADPVDPRHGTMTGVKAHWAAGVPLCPRCRETKNSHDRTWRAERKQTAA